MEQGSQIANKNTVSTQYYLDEILHSLINLILIIKQQDFDIVTKNTIKATVDNKNWRPGRQCRTDFGLTLHQQYNSSRSASL